MEYILGIVIIVILLLILGFGLDIIISGFLWLLALATAVTEVFFIFFTVRLILSKKTEGTFSRIGRPEKSRFDAPYYSTPDGEKPNVFPAEFVMRDRIYKEGRTVKLRADRFRGFVYDRNARVTICFGLCVCTVLCALFVISVPYIMPTMGG